MGKKKRKHPSVDEVLQRPWCFYCERDFDDLKILINHQKAKHFKCDRCGRRLNTAGGLNVHMNQVHKETPKGVTNALPGREGLDIEIFGMEGVPEEARQTHQQTVVQKYYEQQADRAKNTGNPAPGSGEEVVRKKPRTETTEELKARLHQWIQDREAGRIPAARVPEPMTGVEAGPQTYPSQPPPHLPPGVSALPGQHYGAMPVPGQFPPGFPAGLPQRPPGDLSRSVDELISSTAAEAQAPAEKGDKKGKKDKKEQNTRLVYSDNDVSPEERMSKLQKYAFTPEVKPQDLLASTTGEAGMRITGPATEDHAMTG